MSKSRTATALKTAVLIFFGFTVVCTAATSAIDDYYPSDEGLEFRDIVWPQVQSVHGPTAVIRDVKGGTLQVSSGSKVGPWEVDAILDGKEPLVVIERNFSEWGIIAWVGAGGPVASLRKSVGSLASIRAPKVFPTSYFDPIANSEQDVLADRLQQQREGPSYNNESDLLPPLDTYTFLGTETSETKVVVNPDGSLGWPFRDRTLKTVLFDPWKEGGRGIDKPRVSMKQGLVGGYLPVIDYGAWDAVHRAGWEEIAFATGKETPITWVRVSTTSGQNRYWRLPENVSVDGAEFYRQLLELSTHWKNFFAQGSDIHVPEERVNDAARASIVRALTSQVGAYPKYGQGVYWDHEHDTFPPTIILLSLCLSDWGLEDNAGTRLGYYLDHFVKRDGTFDYYGPAISEYGQVLTVAARYVQLTGDTEWLHRHLGALTRIADYLVSQIELSVRTNPANSPLRGLLFGAAEADLAKDKRYYFANDVWGFRGLLDFGTLLQNHSTVDDQHRGGRYVSAAAGLKEATIAAIRKYTVADFLPPTASKTVPFRTMTQDVFASYTNYRYWLEMLSGDLLTPDMRDRIINYRTSHGGEVLDTTRIEDHLDDWTYAHYAWGLLDADLTDRYLIGFFADLAHHRTPGTFTAYEQVPIRGDATRTYVADYCTPAEVVTPQLLRWALVWDKWDGSDLWLARAVPKSWYDQGFTAKNVPTRWGRVTLSVTPEPDGPRAEVAMASPHSATVVHLRLGSATHSIRNVKVQGCQRWKWHPEKQVVDLTGAWRHVVVTAEP